MWAFVATFAARLRALRRAKRAPARVCRVEGSLSWDAGSVRSRRASMTLSGEGGRSMRGRVCQGERVGDGGGWARTEIRTCGPVNWVSMTHARDIQRPPKTVTVLTNPLSLAGIHIHPAHPFILRREYRAFPFSSVPSVVTPTLPSALTMSSSASGTIPSMESHSQELKDDTLIIGDAPFDPRVRSWN